MSEAFHLVNIDAAGETIKEAIKEAIETGGLTPHDPAGMASTFETQEARELTKRWKTIYAKYANLSKRYWNIIKQCQALRMLRPLVRERFVALDEQFDGVCEEMQALFHDLAEWGRSVDRD